MDESGAVDVMELAKAVLQLGIDGSPADALKYAVALADDYPESAIAHRVLGDLNLAAAIDARNADVGSEERKGQLDEESHLIFAREELSEARRLVPDCVDIATALGDAFTESSMDQEAMIEYLCALNISLPVDPALNNPWYGLYDDGTSSVDQRVRKIRERVREAYKYLLGEEVDGVLGALHALQDVRSLGQRIPGSARASILEAYADLEYIRSLPPDLDTRAMLQHPLQVLDSAAISFPNSVVIASFHAKLQFLLGKHDDAEAECRRALALEDPDDPEKDCIPPGSISGADRSIRLSLVSCQFDKLILSIVGSARDYWEKRMTAERRGDFMRVRLDALQEEYTKVDHKSRAFSISAAQSLFKEHSSWRFWVCPVCDDKNKYVETGSLLEHMCDKHPKRVLPRFKSIIDPRVTLESDDSLDGMSFSVDSKGHDIICFQERNNMFKWLFSAPSSGVRAAPFAEIQSRKKGTGNMLLEDIKKNLLTLRTNKSATQSAKVFSAIQELWRCFVKYTVLDYGDTMLTIARTFLWRELKICMDGDPEIAATKITTDDIDAVFANSCSVDEETKEEDASYQTGEIDRFSIYKSIIDAFNTHTEDLSSLHLIIQTLWSLKLFRNEFRERKKSCSNLGHNERCIADTIHEIFSFWEKNDLGRIPFSFTDLKLAMCQSLGSKTSFHKGARNALSDMVATIVNGLHMSDAFLHLGFLGEFVTNAVNPVGCRYCICRDRDLVGLEFIMNMSCGCQICSAEKDAGSPETSEVKAIGEGKCEHCSSENIARFISDTQHFSTIVIYWSSLWRESRVTLRQMLDSITVGSDGIMSGPKAHNMNTQCYEGIHFTTKYALAAMVCHGERGPVSIIRDKDRWLIHGRTRDSSKVSWERLRDLNLRPGVFFFEVIK